MEYPLSLTQPRSTFFAVFLQPLSLTVPIRPIATYVQYLLNLVGVTATNSSFIIGQAFLSAETTKDYAWVLNGCTTTILKPSCQLLGLSALTNRGVPHLLCIWHVNNDVEAYCRKL